MRAPASVNAQCSLVTPMITAILIANAKGDVLMSKFYLDDVRKNVADVFRIQVINAAGTAALKPTASADNRLPVLTLGLTSFLYIQSGSLWIVAVVRSNQDSLLILEFLYNLESLLKHLFSKGSARNLAEEDITSNFVTIYDILSESVDFGYPINLEPSYLASVLPGLKTISLGKEDYSWKPKSTLEKIDTSSPMDDAYDPVKISWRDHNIKYRKNEVFLNVDEKITHLMDGKGNVLRSHIDGAINMRSHLSGMPVCRFGFSSENLQHRVRSLTLDDFKFHKCVDLAMYDAERVIRFVPPDGSFQLMTYHIKDSFALPFTITPEIVEADGLVNLKIRVRSNFSSKSAASGVALKIIMPQNIGKEAISCSNGKAKFDPQDNAVYWKFSKFYGDLEHLISIDTFNDSGWFKPKITLDFSLDMYSASGLQVKYLKVSERSNYRTIKWVKYNTFSGSYEVRL